MAFVRLIPDSGKSRVNRRLWRWAQNRFSDRAKSENNLASVRPYKCRSHTMVGVSESRQSRNQRTDGSKFLCSNTKQSRYDIVVGRELDIFARCRLRSLFIEVKSSLAGGKFGSQADISQLDGYLVACQRNGAERWLGTMGIKPMNLHDTFRTAMRRGNVGLIDIRWVSAKDTLLPHLPSVP